MSDPEDVVIWVPEIWAEAWEVYSRHGNQKGAMAELRTISVCCSMRTGGERRPKRPTKKPSIWAKAPP